MIRDAERRADPTDEYDQIAVVVAAIVRSCCCRWSRTSPRPWAGLAGGLVGAACGLAAALGGPHHRRRRMSKFTPLNDELHDYMVDHGARQDDVLRRVQEETAAMGDDLGDADRARPGRAS